MSKKVYVLMLEGEPQHVYSNSDPIFVECVRWLTNHWTNGVQHDYNLWLSNHSEVHPITEDDEEKTWGAYVDYVFENGTWGDYAWYEALLD